MPKDVKEKLAAEVARIEALAKTGIENPERLVDAKRIEELMPRVTEAAYRARFGANQEAIARGAFAAGQSN